MEKNINHGNIITQEGDINIGDTYVTNIFEGLSQLLTEYREQLRNIEELVNAFKVRTALNLLTELEMRVKEIQHNDKNKILSKIYFLKALCKRELDEVDNKEVARDFITAHRFNPGDTKMRDRACVEYLNIDEKEKSLAMASEILATDEYNIPAWYVKAITASDLKSFIPAIPSIVLQNYNFQLSLIQHIITTVKLNFFEDLADYNLQLNIDFCKYEEVTFNSLDAWRLATDLAINKFFNDFPIRYVYGDTFILQNNLIIKPVFNLLERYIQKLQDTEIKDSINHQIFFYAYFGYISTNEETYFNSLKAAYPKLEKPLWFYTFSYCQILNHKKDFEESIKKVHEYESEGGVLDSEVYLFKAALYHLMGRGEEVVEIFGSYLDSISVIDERNGFNIISAFLNILYRKVSEDVLYSQLDKIRQKAFKNDGIRRLLEITIMVRYLKKFDETTVFNDLISLQSFTEFGANWRNLIVENLNSIGKRNEAIKFLESYLDKSLISESLRFFIVLLYAQLCDKNDQEKGRYAELLDLLNFWRLNSKHPDDELLKYEHNLYTEINDLEKLQEIDSYLYKAFPGNEQYILIYLNTLERIRNFERIKEVIDCIPLDIENESFGVTVSIILIRTKVDIKKGFELLYKLASNPNNTIARKNYFASSHMLKGDDFFKNFETVIIGSWVTYSVANKKEHLKIEKESGLQKEFLGKNVGETFTTIAGVSKSIIPIQILEITNDALHLLRNIQEEAHNPVNELGFESLPMPQNIEDFEDFLKANFGSIGSKEKEMKEKALDDYFNYRNGFSEIARTVFDENYIDAYYNLTRFVGHKFMTLPSIVTKQILKEDHENTTYALDFSTLLLFYFLEKELGFEFSHKYAISYLLKVEIDREIIELTNSPSSPFSLQITNDFVRKHEMPEDYNQKRIEFLQLLLDWIDKHCVIDLVPEKLDLMLKFSNQEKLGDFMKLLIDNICISDRIDTKLISSDLTLFLFSKRGNTIGNIINPEKYLTTFYPEKCDIDFYRFLLKSSYVGININLETLKNEFYQYLGNGQNFYNLCLENLQFVIHGNPQIIVMLSKFLRELYVMQSLTIEQKNSYAYNIFSRAVYGMPKNVLIDFNRKLQEEFRLMGNLYDEVFSVLKAVIN